MVTTSASRSAVTLNNACRHDRDVFCNQLRIEAIIFGEDAAGTGELTKFARIDASDGQATYERGIIRILLAAGLSVRCINPSKLRQFARARGILAKNDRQ